MNNLNQYGPAVTVIQSDSVMLSLNEEHSWTVLEQAARGIGSAWHIVAKALPQQTLSATWPM